MGVDLLRVEQKDGARTGSSVFSPHLELTQGLQNHRCISAAIVSGTAVEEIQVAVPPHIPSSHLDIFFLSVSLSWLALCLSCCRCFSYFQPFLSYISSILRPLSRQGCLGMGKWLLCCPLVTTSANGLMKLKNRLNSGRCWYFIHLTVNSVWIWIASRGDFWYGFPFPLSSLFLNFVTKVSFEYLMLSRQPLFPWCWSFEYVAVVSVLLARNFTSHFFFVSLNSNRWQGNTYGTVNYLLGVHLSGPHSESIYMWLIQAEKKCSLRFGIDWWLHISRGRHFLEMDW